jgi:hypothetical protein
VTNPVARERAALDVLALLPERWAVGPTSYDPGIGRWSYTARGPHPGRGKYPETITGTGEDELAAMTDLRIRLDKRRKAERLDDIERRGRAAFLEGAEVRSRDVEGRPLSADELERVTKRCP